MLRVWVGERPAGLLDRHKNRGSAFTYADPSDDVDAISLTMPKRLASWTVRLRLGAHLRHELARKAPCARC